MGIYRLYVFLGYFSIAVGVCCALSIYRAQTLYYGMALSILGFLISGANIFLGVKHGFGEERISKGYWGMFLSSLPILFLFFLKYKP